MFLAVIFFKKNCIMSVCKDIYEMANKIAVKMTKQGWASPGRKNVVSTSKTVDMINMIFDEIYKELEENGRICIPGQMMFKEVKTKKGSDEANHIECIKKRKD